MIPLKDDIPSSTYPYVTVSVISINVAVFIYQISLGVNGQEAFILRMAAIPYRITRMLGPAAPSAIPPPFTILSAMFVHGGLLHVGGNMLFLWIFGDNIEDAFGHFKFAVFYIFTGITASLTHILLEPVSTVPMIGASGAIAGVLGAYFIFFPRAQVKTLVFLIFFVTVVRIPAVLFLGFWFLFQIMGIGFGGGIAWYAHIGGFISGALIAAFFKPRKRPAAG